MPDRVDPDVDRALRIVEKRHHFAATTQRVAGSFTARSWARTGETHARHDFAVRVGDAHIALHVYRVVVTMRRSAVADCGYQVYATSTGCDAYRVDRGERLNCCGCRAHR